MKKLVAKRRLKNGCCQCKKPILKGHVYYKKRTVCTEEWGIWSYAITYCPKCKHRNENRDLRFKKFKEKCKHPKEFIDEIWTNMPGEAVKEPSHCECRLCGSYL